MIVIEALIIRCIYKPFPSGLKVFQKTQKTNKSYGTRKKKCDSQWDSSHQAAMQRWQQHFGFSHTRDNLYCYATAGVHRLPSHLHGQAASLWFPWHLACKTPRGGYCPSADWSDGVVSLKPVVWDYWTDRLSAPAGKRSCAKHGNSHSTIAMSSSSWRWRSGLFFFKLFTVWPLKNWCHVFSIQTCGRSQVLDFAGS